MYARYNYNGATTQSEANLLADIVKMLTGVTDKTQLNGRLIISSQAVGITSASLVVLWAGALTNVTCAVGQGVSGTGIPTGASIASIQDGVGFTLNTAHEATATSDHGAITMTLATPSVFTHTGHGFVPGSAFTLSTTGALYTGLVAGTTYYVSTNNCTATTFKASDTYAHAIAGTNEIATSGSQSGVHNLQGGGSVLILDNTATLPSCSIGSTTVASTFTNTTTLTMTAATTDIFVVGSKLTGPNITGTATVTAVAANTVTVNAVLVGTNINNTFVLDPTAACCDTTNTFILNTYTNAGWTVWDSCAGGSAGKYNTVILRQPIWDDTSNQNIYHCIGLDISTTGYIQISQYESWNNVTHTPTFQSNALSITKQQRTLYTAANSMMIKSSPTCLMLQSNVTSLGIGASNANEWTGVFQRTRKSPWDTTANSYPPVILTSGYESFAGPGTIIGNACPRYKNPAGGDFSTTNAVVECAILGWGSNYTSGAGGPIGPYAVATIYKKVPDGLGGFYTPLVDINYQSGTNSFMGGSISAACDVWLGVAYPLNLDEMSANSKTYAFWQNTNAATTSTCNMVVSKG